MVESINRYTTFSLGNFGNMELFSVGNFGKIDLLSMGNLKLLVKCLYFVKRLSSCINCFL